VSVDVDRASAFAHVAGFVRGIRQLQEEGDDLGAEFWLEKVLTLVEAEEARLAAL
jgi:hypothetical protein